MVEQRLCLGSARSVALGLVQSECCVCFRGCVRVAPERRQDASEFELRVGLVDDEVGSECVLDGAAGPALGRLSVSLLERETGPDCVRDRPGYHVVCDAELAAGRPWPA